MRIFLLITTWVASVTIVLVRSGGRSHEQEQEHLSASMRAMMEQWSPLANGDYAIPKKYKSLDQITPAAPKKYKSLNQITPAVLNRALR